jgi:hypothetical protein
MELVDKMGLHRIQKEPDFSALIGRERGHKIIVAGDLNILY